MKPAKHGDPLPGCAKRLEGGQQLPTRIRAQVCIHQQLRDGSSIESMTNQRMRDWAAPGLSPDPLEPLPLTLTPDP